MWAYRQRCQRARQCTYNQAPLEIFPLSFLSQVISLVVRSNFCAARPSDETGVAPNLDEIIYRDTPIRPLKSDKEVEYVKTINRMLPPDIRVLAWAPVSKDFNARYAAQQLNVSFPYPASLS